MYHGLYKSAIETNCSKQIMTQKQEKLGFPASIIYNCDLCKKDHSFIFINTFSVSTPSQKKAFEEYCQNLSIEQNIEYSN